MSSSDPYKALLMQRVMVKALVTSNIIQSVCLVGKGRLKERCGLEPRTDFFFRLRNRQKLVRIRFENIRYLDDSGTTCSTERIAVKENNAVISI